MSELAVQLIKDYKEAWNNSKRLNLGNCGLNENNIPNELSELTDLETLILSNQYYDTNIKAWCISSKNNGERNFFGKIPKVISKLSCLKVLIFSGDQIEQWKIKDIEILSNLKSLVKLNLSYNQIEDITALKELTNIQELNLSLNKIVHINALKKLNKLKKLNLFKNRINNIYAIRDLTNVISLNLSANKITNINRLHKLTALKSLYIGRNKFNNIQVLGNFVNLKTLNLSMIKIKDIHPLEKLIDYHKLVEIELYKSPIKAFDTSERKNYIENLNEYFDRQRGIEKVKVQLPVKIVLLGNHASGKSTFTNFFIDNQLKSEDSTHILRIENHPSNNENNELPEAVFFDFGGQDYYHGLYRIYLSKYALNLIFWNEATNRNSFGTNDSNGFPIHNFSAYYWLSSMYFNKEYYYEELGKAIVVKTHIDKSNKEELRLDDYKILKSFSCCLNEDDSSNNLYEEKKHLKEFLTSEIYTIRNENTSEQPQWYIDFLTFLYNHKPENPFEPLTFEFILENHYERRVHENKRIEYLDINLKELHRSGIILYYTNEDLDFDDFIVAKTNHGLIWTNPSGLVKKLHQKIFNKEKLLKSSTRGRISLKELGLEKKKDEAIIKLLQIQKVIFNHLVYNEDGLITTDEYILPNFLPLATEDENYELLTLEFAQSRPKFILHFMHFLPFGLINQLICYFGKQPDNKCFWRDQIVFSLSNMAIVFIQIDFQKLQINVHYKIFETSISKISENEMNRYLFFIIMRMYWDYDTPVKFIDQFEAEYFPNSQPTYSDSFSDRYHQFMGDNSCQPMDLYLSVNCENFVPYRELYTGGKHVMVKNTDGERKSVEKEIFNDFIEGVPINVNQSASENKKIFISYAREDIKYREKLERQLKPLLRNKQIKEIWTDHKILAGQDWNAEIEAKLKEADIVFLLISDDFFASDYIDEKELPIVKDRYDKKACAVIPILVRPSSHWGDSRWTFLQAIPSKNGGLTAVSKWEDTDDAWKAVTDAIKLVL